jgi:hypothetical protein
VVRYDSIYWYACSGIKGVDKSREKDRSCDWKGSQKRELCTRDIAKEEIEKGIKSQMSEVGNDKLDGLLDEEKDGA